jgi:hypothetical protein
MSDYEHFARPDVQRALSEFAQADDGSGDVNTYLADRGLAPPSGDKIFHPDIIICPPGYRPVPVSPQPPHSGAPPFCKCDPV